MVKFSDQILVDLSQQNTGPRTSCQMETGHPLYNDALTDCYSLN